MFNFLWEKSTILKSGREVLLRFPREGDASLLLDYINPIVEENTYILMNELQTLEEETEYVSECIKNLEQNNAVYIYAQFENRIVGVCDIRRQRHKMSHTGLLGITVAQDFRRDGLGRILMEQAMEFAKKDLGLEMITLTCFAKNFPALDLYQSLGFKEAGRVPAMIKHNGVNMDQVEMYRQV